MSLPKYFDNPKQYFEESVNFFQEFHYLYDTPNTDVLVRKILDNIDKSNDDIDSINNCNRKENNFLNNFFNKIERFKVYNGVVNNNKEHDHRLNTDTQHNVKVPLSPKKKHEIIYLANEIKSVCGNSECAVVVDFGSGLGYLDQLIFETTNYKVLGIECKESHYIGAKKRQRKYHHSSIENVKYVKHRVNENSDENIKKYLEDKFPDHKQFCITGLHACADLSIDAINLFFKMANAKALVIMPCCYHKMTKNGNGFNNFPMSHCLQEILKRNTVDYIGVPFLRLAAQPPSLEEKLDDLVFNLLSRAVLQLYANRNNCKLKRNKRKAVKTKNMENSFNHYVHDATTSGFTMFKNEPTKLGCDNETYSFNNEELLTIWNELPPMTFKKAEIFIRLQNCLQPIIENFVLYDRILYMKENGVTNCEFKKILNERISPRCLALIAFK